jgi:hypothetical protein
MGSSVLGVPLQPPVEQYAQPHLDAAQPLRLDPGLSCSTHAFGAMPLHLELVGPDGSVLDEVRR